MHPRNVFEKHFLIKKFNRFKRNWLSQSFYASTDKKWGIFNVTICLYFLKFFTILQKFPFSGNYFIFTINAISYKIWVFYIFLKWHLNLSYLNYFFHLIACILIFIICRYPSAIHVHTLNWHCQFNVEIFFRKAIHFNIFFPKFIELNRQPIKLLSSQFISRIFR